MKTKFNLILTLLLVFIVQIVSGQEKKVSGVVSDVIGPMLGVNVIKKGTNDGIDTDMNGEYSIQAKVGDVLVFTFMGYEAVEKTVGSSSKINLVMKEASNVLAPVVVTALGIKREKKSIGYASQEIKGDALTGGTTKTGNVASQLSGKVAGLNVNTTNNFGGSANMVIRGVKSLGGGGPLIVIDGSPVDNSSTSSGGNDFGNALSDINQDDIASMNVLKGAAASALYGERGINGVIVITTKNGRSKSDGSWGIRISSGLTVGVIDKSTFPEYQKSYGAGYSQDWDHGADYGNYDSDGSWGNKYNKDLNIYHWDAFDTTSPNFGKKRAYVLPNNDASAFFETSFMLNNSISIEKGESGKNLTFTYENSKSDWILPNSELDKNNFSLKANYDLTPKVHTSFYGSLTLQETQGRNTTGYNDNLMTMFRQWWATDVDVLEQKDAYFRNKAIASKYNNYGNVTWNRQGPGSKNPAYWNNPYFQLYENYSSDSRFRTFNYARLTYDINDNLSATGKVSYDRSNLDIEQRLAVGANIQQFGAAGNDVGSGYAMKKIGRQEVNLDLMLNYDYKFTEEIGVNGVLGGNIRKNDYDEISASTEGGLVVPNVYALSNSVKIPLDPDEIYYNTETNSGYVTASFDFYKKFYLDATWRLDKTSTLPSGNNVYSYPSVTGALILSEFIKPDFLNFWKIRANYAEVGATADPYQLKEVYNSAGLLNGSKIYKPNYIKKNPDLKPQRSKEFELGTEFVFAKKRVTLDLAYYKTQTFDQIISLPVSAASGYTNKVVNAGQIDNSGFEVQLGVVPFKNDKFTWNVDMNWSTNKNKVVALSGDSKNYLLDSYAGGVSMNAFVGEAWGTLIGQGYQYDDKGNKIVVVSKDGNYAKYARKEGVKLGNVTPDWIGGIRNSFTYKGFGASFLLDVRKGGKIYSTDMYYGLATGLYKETAENGVRENGTIQKGVIGTITKDVKGKDVVNSTGVVNTLPARDAGSFGSNAGYKIDPTGAFVYDGDFVKLREASISYKLSNKFLQNSFINDVKFSLVARNLWIIYKDLPYADPEAMVGGGIKSYGNSIGSTPTTRDIGFNVTFKF